MRRVALGAGLCAMVAVPLLSQTANQQPSIFRADTHLVQVSVVVRDGRLNPLTDLTAADFQVFEDGKQQPIALFSADSRASGTPATTVVPGTVIVSNQVPTTGGVTVILFDRLNTAWSDQGQAKQNIVKFLSQVAPTERIGFYVLDSSSVSIVHDFTSDTRSLLRALGRVQGQISRETMIAEEKTPTIASGGGMSAAMDAQLDAALARMDEMIKADAVKNRADSTLSALEAVARHLAGIPGRKNLIWISSSFPLSFNDGFGTRSMYTEVNIATRAIADANVSVYPVDARGLMNSSAVVTRKPTYASLRNEMPASDSMEMLAERTGGVAYTNRNDLGRAISRAVEDAKFTYTMATPPRT